MAEPLFNRQDDQDVIESGIYQVPRGSQVRIGYPLKLSGSVGGQSNPVYTKYRGVVEYTDVNSTERCIGVSDDQIPAGTGTKAEALLNIEFRHLRRDVAVVKEGVRLMKNMGTTTLEDTDIVAPYPGGCIRWVAGKQILGTVKRGPIAYGKKGMVRVHAENNPALN